MKHKWQHIFNLDGDDFDKRLLINDLQEVEEQVKAEKLKKLLTFNSEKEIDNVLVTRFSV